MDPWQIIGWGIVVVVALILAVLALVVVLGLFTSAHEMWLRAREVRHKRKVALATEPCAGQVWLLRLRGVASRPLDFYIRTTAVSDGLVFIEPMRRDQRGAPKLPTSLTLEQWKSRIQQCDLTYVSTPPRASE